MHGVGARLVSSVRPDTFYWHSRDVVNMLATTLMWIWGATVGNGAGVGAGIAFENCMKLREHDHEQKGPGCFTSNMVWHGLNENGFAATEDCRGSICIEYPRA